MVCHNWYKGSFSKSVEIIKRFRSSNISPVFLSTKRACSLDSITEVLNLKSSLSPNILLIS